MTQDTGHAWTQPHHRSDIERRASKRGDHPNVLRTLERDHQVLRERFRELLEMNDDERFEKSFREARAELLAHFEAEEATFYSHLLQIAEPLASHCASEHQQLQDILRELEQRPTGADRMELFATLESGLRTHFEHEEGVVFQLAIDVMGAEQLARIDQDYRRLCSKARRQHH